MINKLSIKNVKCFTSANFNLASLTIFCGANSAGKSTAIQTLLLLRQSFESGKKENKILMLMGKYFSLGHCGDFISHNASGDELSIIIDEFKFSQKLKDINLSSFSMHLDQQNFTHPLFTKHMNYLSAYRLGPQNSHDDYFDDTNLDIGIYGENAIPILARFGNKPAINKRLANAIIKEKGYNTESPDDIDTNLDIAAKEAMKDIFPDFYIDVKRYEDMDKVRNTFSSEGNSNAVRPINTGFGLTYVLPIIVAALCTEEGGILIVENPEVHLHPEAQSKLAEFLYLTSLNGIQVIIETHSDHILNGTRVYSKEKSIASGHVKINSIRSEFGKRIITEIDIDDEGILSDSDKGLLDQIEKDLVRLF